MLTRGFGVINDYVTRLLAAQDYIVGYRIILAYHLATFGKQPWHTTLQRQTGESVPIDYSFARGAVKPTLSSERSDGQGGRDILTRLVLSGSRRRLRISMRENGFDNFPVLLL